MGGSARRSWGRAARLPGRRACRITHRHAAIPASRFEVFPGAGHFPMLDDPARFVALVTDWMTTTELTQYDDERLDAVIRERSGGTAT